MGSVKEMRKAVVVVGSEGDITPYFCRIIYVVYALLDMADFIPIY